MMLEKLSLTNFKAFHRHTEIPLAPITLIYGDNASGKSAIVQGLALLAQSTPEEDVDAYSGIRFSGSFVDLSNFPNVISRHDVSQDLVIAFSAELPQGRGSVQRSSYGSAHSLTLNISLTIDQGEPGGGGVRVKAADLQLSGVRDLSVSLRAGRIQIGHQAPIRQTLEAKFDPTMFVEFARAERHARSSSHQGSTSGSPTPDEDSVETQGARIELSSNDDWSEEMRNVLEAAVLACERVGAYGPFESVLRGPWPARFRLAQGLRESFNDVLHDARSSNWTQRHADAGVWQLEDVLQVFRRNVERPVRDLMRQMGRIHYLGPARSGPNRLEPVSGVDDWARSGDGSGLVQELLTRPGILASINETLKDLKVPYNLRAQYLQPSHSPSAGKYAFLTLTDTRNDTDVSLRDVGYGLSQMIPILASVKSKKSQLVIVEQPELHLHPNLQANLVESLARDCIRLDKQLVLETHSENMLLRIQKMIRERDLSNDQVSVIYVGNSSNEGAWIQCVQFNADGTMATAWPGDFFESRMREWT